MLFFITNILLQVARIKFYLRILQVTHLQGMRALFEFPQYLVFSRVRTEPYFKKEQTFGKFTLFWTKIILVTYITFQIFFFSSNKHPINSSLLKCYSKSPKNTNPSRKLLILFIFLLIMTFGTVVTSSSTFHIIHEDL